MPFPATTTRILLRRLLLALVSGVWFLCLEYIIDSPRTGLVVSIMAIALVVLWMFRWRLRTISPGSLRIGTFILMATSVTALNFMSVPQSQHGLAILGSLALFIYLQQSTEHTPEELQGRVTTAIMTLSYWFGMLTLLSLGIFFHWAWWQLVILAAVLLMGVATVIWMELGVPAARWRPVVPMIGLLGAELMLAVWWLPTSILVGSSVATVVGMLFLHLCRHIWLNTWREGRGKRYVLIGVSIMVIVLLSARWI